MKYDKVIKELTQAGWYPGRKISVLENVEFLESRGFEVFDTAKKFMEEFGELKIVVEQKLAGGRVMVSKHDTTIKDIIGISDSSWYGLEEYIDEKVLPVGRVDNGEFVLYIGESGKVYLSLGRAGDTVLEAFENIISRRRSMLNIKEMIKDIEGDYIRDTARIDARYALAKLWDDFDDSDPDEEMLLYNLTIASFNVKSGEVTDGERKRIKEVMSKYDEDSEMIKESLDEEGNKILLEMVTYIKEKIRGN